MHEYVWQYRFRAVVAPQAVGIDDLRVEGLIQFMEMRVSVTLDT